jgi:hypothetical protein
MNEDIKERTVQEMLESIHYSDHDCKVIYFELGFKDHNGVGHSLSYSAPINVKELLEARNDGEDA